MRTADKVRQRIKSIPVGFDKQLGLVFALSACFEEVLRGHEGVF